MQQVLNSRERSQSFWKFFLFFFITILVVLLAVYFDFRMPLVENKKLKVEIADQRELSAYEDRFALRVEAVSNMLDSIEKNPANADNLHDQLDSKLKDLYNFKEFQENGISSPEKMYTIIVNKLSKVNSLLKSIDKLNEQYQDLEKKYNTCRDDLNQYMKLQSPN